MEKIKVEICVGTACFVMGSSVLLKIKERIPSRWSDSVEVSGILCCDLCKNWKEHKPPIVRIDGIIIARADDEKIISTIKERLLEGDNAQH